MQVEASYTVEMAVLMVCLLLAILLPIYVSYNLYAQVKETSLYVQEQKMRGEDTIRLFREAEKYKEDLKK